jgi:hypothetical protein
MVHVASSRISCGDEPEDRRVDVMGCIGLFYPNFAVFIVLGYKAVWPLVFLYIGPQGLVERIKYSAIPLPRPSLRSLFLLRCGYASCFREERREVRDLPNLAKSGRMFLWFPHS